MPCSAAAVADKVIVPHLLPQGAGITTHLTRRVPLGGAGFHGAGFGLGPFEGFCCCGGHWGQRSAVSRHSREGLLEWSVYLPGCSQCDWFIRGDVLNRSSLDLDLALQECLEAAVVSDFVCKSFSRRVSVKDFCWTADSSL